MKIPNEIYTLVVEIGEFTLADLKELAFVSHQWAKVALPLIWQTRKFIENDSLQIFKKTLINDNAISPYGQYIKKLQIDELDKNPPILIDAELIKFIANHCPNLKELSLRFRLSQKERNNTSSYSNNNNNHVKSWELPLELLGDRLVRLSLVAYEHSEPRKSRAQTILDKICDDDNDGNNNNNDNNNNSSNNKSDNSGSGNGDDYTATIKSTVKMLLDRIRGDSSDTDDSDDNSVNSESDSVNNNNNNGKDITKDLQIVPSHDSHDGLCEIMRLGNIKSIRLYYPDMSPNIWNK